MANPTDGIGTSTSLSPSGSFTSSRIRFPIDDSSPSRPWHPSPETHVRASSLAFKPPARRTSPLNPQKSSLSTNPRRRFRSVDPADAPLDSPRPRRIPISSLTGPSREIRGIEAHAQGDKPEPGMFSDEYDLSHEDPRILQDVQRALMLKARREARMNQHNSSAPKVETSPAHSGSKNPVFSALSSPTPRKASLSSEIDFSPSIGGSLMHPVPASLDNGITLDWSGFAFSDRSDKRWKISTSKQRDKDMLPPLSVVIDLQEKTHSDKISRIKTIATPQTLRKAEITSEQLKRRYDLLYRTLSSGSSPLSLAKVVRWYGAQDSVVRGSLEKAEPFTWLKHLDKRSVKPDRPPWYLSALIMEEYVHSQARHEPMRTIPEDFVSSELASSTPTPPLLTSNTPPSVTALASSYYSSGPSLANQPSFEGRITFEPLVEPTTNFQRDSHRSGESFHGSSFSGTSNSAITAGANPLNNNSSLQTRDLAPRIFTKLMNTSDQASSVDDLSSEPSDQGEQSGVDGHKKPDYAGLGIEREAGTPEVSGGPLENDDNPDPQTGITLRLTIPTPRTNSTGALGSAVPHSQVQDLTKDDFIGFRRRRVRTSLHSVDRLSKEGQNRRRKDASDEKAYELKARLLKDTTAHNHRVRQLLNRISVSVREYETVQSNAMASLAISHKGLPRELLDAFGHDPAAVTGATRRYRGWRAVDDIHNRLLRQREVFQAFLSYITCDTPIPKSVLDDPITSLVHSVETLEVHSCEMAGRAADVGEVLAAVQSMHTAVKTDYKRTLSHTSVVYPELSIIVALEESYKDQYQQFWEFGMDTLTFLLDTVTPFWRTYGKPIGEDVRDFLVIPLYRNEFTGESKRYPIKGFPNRSLRHWLGLVLFFLASIITTILQARAAISSATHYTLPMIPYESVRWTALPFFWMGIIIQWWAVLAELAIVLVQIGVLMWWVGWSVKIFT